MEIDLITLQKVKSILLLEGYFIHLMHVKLKKIMKLDYLFPHKYKKIGWVLLVPAVIAGLVVLIWEVSPKLFEVRLPAVFMNQLFGETKLFGIVTTNILDDLIGLIIIVSSLLVAFSKEKIEDEYISKIRLESLVWAVYVNYAILFFSFIILFDLSFFYVMICNMFTVLLFFIIRFNWQISKLHKTVGYEE